MYYGLDLDDCMDELWHEMERVQDGGSGHHIAIESNGLNSAAQSLAARLVPFFEKRMYLSDSDGYKTEDAKEIA